VLSGGFVLDPEKNSNLDSDILQAKADILRAKNLIPPFGRPPVKAAEPQPEAMKQDSITTQSPAVIEPALEQTLPEVKIESPEIVEVTQENIPEVHAQAELEPEVIVQEETEPVAEFEIEPDEDDIIINGDFGDENENDNEVEFISQQMLKQSESADDEEKMPEIQIDEHHEQFSIESSDDKIEIETEPPHNQDVPRFNLAEQIMAEQRKFISQKRKGPGSRSSAQPAPADTVSESPVQPAVSQKQTGPLIAPEIATEALNEPTVTSQPPRQRIVEYPVNAVISKIVARDIEKLRAGIEVF
jgi:hypothetical protein